MCASQGSLENTVERRIGSWWEPGGPGWVGGGRGVGGMPQGLGVLISTEVRLLATSRPWSHVLAPGDTLSLGQEGHGTPTPRAASSRFHP